MKCLRQMMRGCGILPHVGKHPATSFFLMMLLAGALAGIRGGVFGVLGGVIFMAVCIGPMYLYGAYDRAQLSERREYQEKWNG